MPGRRKRERGLSSVAAMPLADLVVDPWQDAHVSDAPTIARIRCCRPLCCMVGDTTVGCGPNFRAVRADLSAVARCVLRHRLRPMGPHSPAQPPRTRPGAPFPVWRSRSDGFSRAGSPSSPGTWVRPGGRSLLSA